MKTLTLSALLLTTSLLADSYFSFFTQKSGVAPVKNQAYINECASCHFAYQPGLLPQQSWKKLMSNLENHFDTDASLEESDRVILLHYLVKNAADNATQYKRSKKINRSIPSEQTPIAVSETPYFKKEHRKIPQRIILQKEVKSLSHCMACHTTADKGIYSERALKIPNYGGWDDD